MSVDLFLDRDGTLIKDTGYISFPGEIQILNGVVEGLRLFKSKGYRLHVVSNQSGVARELISIENFRLVEMRFLELFSKKDIAFDSLNYCFHSPESGCSCRKPEIGLFESVAERYTIFKDRSAMIGNAEVDERAANKYGVPFWKVDENATNFISTSREIVNYFD